MQEVQIGTEFDLVAFDVQLPWRVSCGQEVTDGRRLRHADVAVGERRDGAEWVDLQIRPSLRSRWKWQHLELVRQAELLEHPERSKRPRAHAVIKSHGHRIDPFAGVVYLACFLAQSMQRGSSGAATVGLVPSGTTC